MPRRVALPGAQELFRATEPTPDQGLRHSGRVKHDEKITVYVSAAELLALEQARLTLRAQHGIAVDRGRIVRAAVALAVADLDANGEECDLIRQLDAS
ncbi:MAG: hypothetical protein QM582_02520 [Micropruina sp.]|uniref:hypothetical protein n=1 Tax=Micropruina sp. TaxID=2737536 RepID=UPI0039E21D1B